MSANILILVHEQIYVKIFCIQGHNYPRVLETTWSFPGGFHFLSKFLPSSENESTWFPYFNIKYWNSGYRDIYVVGFFQSVVVNAIRKTRLNKQEMMKISAASWHLQIRWMGNHISMIHLPATASVNFLIFAIQGRFQKAILWGRLQLSNWGGRERKPNDFLFYHALT